MGGAHGMRAEEGYKGSGEGATTSGGELGTYRQDERKGESTHEPSTERNERHKNDAGDTRRAEGRTHHTHAEDDTTNEEPYIEGPTDEEDVH